MTELSDNPHRPGTAEWALWNQSWIGGHSDAGHAVHDSRVTRVRGGGIVLARTDLPASPSDPVVDILGGYMFIDPPRPRDVHAEVDAELRRERIADITDIDWTEATAQLSAMFERMAETVAAVAEPFSQMVGVFLEALNEGCSETAALLPTTTGVKPRNAGLVTCPKHGPQATSFCRSCQRGR